MAGNPKFGTRLNPRTVKHPIPLNSPASRLGAPPSLSPVGLPHESGAEVAMTKILLIAAATHEYDGIGTAACAGAAWACLGAEIAGRP
jgi:hypothetical protein